MPLVSPPVTIWSVAKDGNLPALQEFVAQGVAIDSQTRGEVTALHEAAEAGHLAVVQWLLDHGAKPNARTLRNPGDPGSYTPLHLAVEKGHIDVARLLLQRGAKVNAKMSDGTTPLILAASSGRIDLLSLLVQHGGDISFHNQLGFSPFTAAAGSAHWEAAEWLLKAGANVDDRPRGRGATATSLMTAAGNKNVEAVTFLLRHGASVHLQDEKGFTALHWAVIGAAAHVRNWEWNENGKMFEEDNPEDAVTVIRMLLSAGATTTVLDADGFTPTSLAGKLRLAHIVELMEKGTSDTG